jgi:hypothetical protein
MEQNDKTFKTTVDGKSEVLNNTDCDVETVVWDFMNNSKKGDILTIENVTE